MDGSGQDRRADEGGQIAHCGLGILLAGSLAAIVQVVKTVEIVEIVEIVAFVNSARSSQELSQVGRGKR